MSVQVKETEQENEKTIEHQKHVKEGKKHQKETEFQHNESDKKEHWKVIE